MSELTPGIAWEEGLMLRPQHLQALERHCQDVITHVGHARPFAYGVMRLEIREAAIGSWVLEVQSCQILMPDGTLVVADETASIRPVEFRHLANGNRVVEVWLGIPFANSNAPNLADENDKGGAITRRYVAVARETRDENSGVNPQSIKYKLLNARIFVGSRPPDGHATLKIAELERVISEGEEGRAYKLSDRFVPASLNLEAAPQLHTMVRDMQDLLEQANKTYFEKFGASMRGMMTGVSTERPENLLRFQATNGALSVLRQIVKQPKLHPFDVYLFMTRLVGDLAIFSTSTWLAPDLPAYDHDDPLASYSVLRQHWLDLLEKADPTTKVQKYPFQPSTIHEDWLEVALTDDLLRAGVELALGVETKEHPATLESHFATAELRLASPSLIDALRRSRSPGIPCRHDHRLHPDLQGREGLVFLAMPRDHEYWPMIEQERKIVIQGASGNRDQRFWLFVTGAGEK